MRWFRAKFVLVVWVAVALASGARAQENPDPKIVQAARKEGEIVWYTTMSADQSTSFMERFQRKYPFLKPSIIRLGGNALLSRITTEAKAGKSYFDVVHGTGEIVLPLMEMGLLASYISPERKMIAEDLKDKKGFWTSVYVNSIVLGYNTNLTKGQPIPRSYDDLLQPRWRGRKISVDSTYATFLQGLISAWGKDKALDYLRKLAEQEPVVMRGSTVRAQLAAAGEFPLVIAYANIIQYLTEKGAPLDWVPLEPAVISVNTVMAGAKTNHPNAAKLFIDFTLSKEGQEKLWDFQRIPSRSDVEPKPARLFRGYKRYVVHPEEMQNLDETAKLYAQILKTR
ncbi:MAG TPA: extracellular solute-binding protein [Terriglobales bacterium]|nr:extracellular solute-binding protein [Terriglobales bacterium]